MSQQGPFRPLRPIAPRTLADSPAPAPAPEEGKIRRASTACAECKRRRTKCSADSTGTPCSECALHGRECIIDEYADKRRKVAAKRAQEDLRYYRGFVEQLLEAIRFGNRATVDAIVNVIRSGASLDEIRSVVAQSLSNPPKSEDKDPEDPSTGGTSDDVLTDLTPKSGWT